MPSGSARGQHGLAYLLLLATIAILGIASSAAVALGAQMGRRDAEQQLLAVGAEFQQALRSYAGVPLAAAQPSAAASPGRRGPRSLDELLKDQRVPGIHRHLRQIYADPLTGKADWGLVTDSQGAIVGIYSLAHGTPIKQNGFDPAQAGFEKATSYRDWVFGMPGAMNLPSSGP